MLITIDTAKDSHDDMRAAAAFILHLVGDLTEGGIERTAEGSPVVVPPPPPVPTGISTLEVTTLTTGTLREGMRVIGDGVPPGAVLGIPAPPSIPVPPVPAFVANNDSGEDDDETSNVVNFPTQGGLPVPPPPPVMTPTPVTTVAPVTALATVASMAASPGLFDSAGMPWDERIHQKGKSTKRDGTWKLKKGIDPAIVAAVTTELASRKGLATVQAPPATAPAAPATVPLLQGSTVTVPMPPVAPPAPVATVPAPPTSASVPIPPVAPVGPVGAISFRALVDKITAATKDGKLTPQRVAAICIDCGAPNLMQLNAMPQLIDAVNAALDLAIAGLA